MCHNGFGQADGDVACRQLGFFGGASSFGPAESEYSSAAYNGQFWMDYVACTGSEQRLVHCPSRQGGRTGCNLFRDGVKLRCNPAMLRTTILAPSPPPTPTLTLPTQTAASTVLLPSAQCHAACPQERPQSSGKALNEYWRNVGMPARAETDCSNPELPRKFSQASWFEFAGDAGVRMQSEPPGQMCGTQAAGWLSTPHPLMGEPPLRGTVCWDVDDDACGMFSAVETCACSYDGGETLTYTYKLPRPASCDVPSAYCGTSSTTISTASPPPSPVHILTPSTAAAGGSGPATNVPCLPFRSDEALLDFSAATLLHNNLGGVAGHYCATTGEECTSDMSQLGDVGTYPGCKDKTMDDSCYNGIGALATNQRSPRWDRPASAPTASRVVVRSLRRRLQRRDYLLVHGLGHGHRHVHREHHVLLQF